jgi:hypothetical protein
VWVWAVIGVIAGFGLIFLIALLLGVRRLKATSSDGTPLTIGGEGAGDARMTSAQMNNDDSASAVDTYLKGSNGAVNGADVAEVKPSPERADTSPDGSVVGKRR